MMQVLSWEEKAVIFCNLDEIYEIHVKLLSLFEQAIVDGDLSELGRLFLQIDLKSAYSQYCSNHPRAIRLLQERLVRTTATRLLCLLIEFRRAHRSRRCSLTAKLGWHRSWP